MLWMFLFSCVYGMYWILIDFYCSIRHAKIESVHIWCVNPACCWIHPIPYKFLKRNAILSLQQKSLRKMQTSLNEHENGLTIKQRTFVLRKDHTQAAISKNSQCLVELLTWNPGNSPNPVYGSVYFLFPSPYSLLATLNCVLYFLPPFRHNELVLPPERKKRNGSFHEK